MEESGEEFEYEYESEEETEDVEMENLFYEADDNKLSNPKLALEQFRNVVELEHNARGQESFHFRFQALQRIIDLSVKLGLMGQLQSDYEALLGLLPHCTRNEASAAINAVLDVVQPTTSALTEPIYHVTLRYLQQHNLQGLWLRTGRRLCELLLDRGECARVEGMLPELRAAAQSSNKLQVLALELELCRLTKRGERLAEVLREVEEAGGPGIIGDSRARAIIAREQGMEQLKRDEWERAYSLFFEAFRYYQEARCKESKSMLRYASLCNMLALSPINPLDTQEARALERDPALSDTFALRAAFEGHDVSRMMAILDQAGSDDVMLAHSETLLQRTREQLLLRIIEPFAVVRLSTLAKELACSMEQVFALLTKLICFGVVRGQLNLVSNCLEMDAEQAEEDRGLGLQREWVEHLRVLKDGIAPLLP